MNLRIGCNISKIVSSNHLFRKRCITRNLRLTVIGSYLSQIESLLLLSCLIGIIVYGSFLMGFKSRGNWSIPICLRDCKWQETDVCDECFRFSKFEKPNHPDAIGEDKCQIKLK